MYIVCIGETVLGIDKAVILAAGMGERFYRASSEYKLVTRVYGVPLILYPIKSIYLYGVREFTIVVNPIYKEVIRYVIQDFVDREGAEIRVNYIINNEPDKGNGYSLLLALKYSDLEGSFILSMADHIYVPSILEVLETCYSTSNTSVLGGDSRPQYIDSSEATKISVDEAGYVAGVGKMIKFYKYVDIGVHLFNTRDFIPQCISLNNLELSRLITCISRYKRVRVCDVNGLPWTDVDTLEDYLSLITSYRSIVLEEVFKEWRLRERV